jgi:hypothetical protein
MGMNGQVPSQVQVGRTWLAPADLLATLGAALPGWVDGGTADAALRTGHLSVAAHVADHVSWNWTIFPRGFDGDPLLDTAKRQAWTIKPAS